MNLRELIIAYGDARADVITNGEMVSMAEAVASQAEADRLLAEIDRRIALAQADHQLMWRSHLDGTESSVSRQRALLRNADAEQARGWPRNRGEQYVRPDLVEEHRAAKEARNAV